MPRVLSEINSPEETEGTPETALSRRTRKPSIWDREVSQMKGLPGTARSASTWSPQLLGPGKGRNTRPAGSVPCADPRT